MGEGRDTWPEATAETGRIAACRDGVIAMAMTLVTDSAALRIRSGPRACLIETARPSCPLELHRGPTHAVTTVRTIVPELYRLATVGMHQRCLRMYVACSPDGQRPHHYPQFLTLVGEDVFGAWRMV